MPIFFQCVIFAIFLYFGHLYGVSIFTEIRTFNPIYSGHFYFRTYWYKLAIKNLLVYLKCQARYHL